MYVFLSRVSLTCIRSVPTTITYLKSVTTNITPNLKFFPVKSIHFSSPLCMSLRKYSTEGVKSSPSLNKPSLPVKKVLHKKADIKVLSQKEGHYLTFAYVTAHSYDLKRIKKGLFEQKLYEPGILKSDEVGNVLVASAVHNIGTEPREIIFFEEGAVVFWNCNELEVSNMLQFIKPYEVESYPEAVVEKEREVMTYVYHPNARKCYLQDSGFVLVPERDNSLERFTFSHAMAQSARLGAWEAQLESLASSIRERTHGMRTQGAAPEDKPEIIRKLGELFFLRHRLNVESDLLDTPDFYWEEEELEKLYSRTVTYFTISRRTRVLNERLNHCVELLELCSTWAADKHHVRLEWMIIILILVEVCFELLHIVERNVTVTGVEKQRPSERHPPFTNEVEEHLFQDIAIVDTY